MKYSAKKVRNTATNQISWIVVRNGVELGYYVRRTDRGFEIAMIDQVFEGLGAVVTYIAELEGDVV